MKRIVLIIAVAFGLLMMGCTSPLADGLNAEDSENATKMKSDANIVAAYDYISKTYNHFTTDAGSPSKPVHIYIMCGERILHTRKLIWAIRNDITNKKKIEELGEGCIYKYKKFVEKALEHLKLSPKKTEVAQKETNVLLTLFEVLEEKHKKFKENPILDKSRDLLDDIYKLADLDRHPGSDAPMLQCPMSDAPKTNQAFIALTSIEALQ